MNAENEGGSARRGIGFTFGKMTGLGSPFPEEGNLGRGTFERCSTCIFPIKFRMRSRRPSPQGPEMMTARSRRATPVLTMPSLGIMLGSKRSVKVRKMQVSVYILRQQVAETFEADIFEYACSLSSSSANRPRFGDFGFAAVHFKAWRKSSTAACPHKSKSNVEIR